MLNKVSRVIICDVTKDNDVKLLGELVAKVIKEKKLKIWALINNAGVADGGCFDWTPISVYQKDMEVNYFGVLRVTRALLPFFKQSKSSRIINISSVAGCFVCGPLFGAYAGLFLLL